MWLQDSAVWYQCQTTVLNHPLPRPTKIIFLSQSYHNTIAFIEQETSSKVYFVHMSQKTILWRHLLPSGITKFGMISSKEAILPNFKMGRLDILSLSDQKVIVSVPHRFWARRPQEIDLITFEDTQLFCLTEHDFDDLHLSYYSYSDINSESKPTAYFKSVCPKFKWKTLKKLNRHSKVGWYQRKIVNSSEAKTVFSVFSLEENPKGKETLVSAPQEVMGETHHYGEWFFDLVWEISPSHYLLESRHFLQNRRTFATLDSSLKIRYFQLFQNQEDFSLGSDLIEDSFTVENILVVVCLGRECRRRLLLIDLSSREVVWTKLLDGHTKVGVTQWNSTLTFFEQEGQQLTGRMMNLGSNLKDIYMNWLLNYCEDFDDDLLLDAISLLM